MKQEIVLGYDAELIPLDIRDMHEFQGELKELSKADYRKLKKEILETKFNFAPHVWKNPEDAQWYLLDGHQRKRVLSAMREDGHAVPRIPCVAVAAESYQDAKRKVLQGTSQYGEMTSQGLYQFIETAGFNLNFVEDSFRLPEIDFDKFKLEFGDDPATVSESDSVAADAGPKEIFPGTVISLKNGDCLEEMRLMASNSVDALVTDPPAGISFMNAEWDSDKGGRDAWVTWMSEVMRECLRVLKPGAHGLVWAIPRTSHWTGTALENAGFEVRDVVTHLFGTGFPKSLDISKAIDKAAGTEREVVGENPSFRPNHLKKMELYNARQYSGGTSLTAPATDAAKEWQGFGTALKPACEFWYLVRKPLSEKTVAANVLKWGCGGLNIDGSRVEANEIKNRTAYKYVGNNGISMGAASERLRQNGSGPNSPQGRFPANLVLSHNPDCTDTCTDGCAIQMLDEQSGTLRARGNKTAKDHGSDYNATSYQFGGRESGWAGDEGGASRFFYCAKASTREKNEGLEDAEAVKVNDGRETEIDNPFQRGETLRKNTHPTAKSIALMEYLITLITPPNGIVLDCFMGSGTTGIGTLKAGFNFIGIEKEKEFFEIAKARISDKTLWVDELIDS